MSYLQLTQTVIDAFNSLADEVQALADCNTVLEHKLRFAHEQFQYLADKHAPAAPEIAKTLAKLQPPLCQSPPDDASPVPLPKRRSWHSRHQLALIIRDGRRAASKLTSLGPASKTTVSTARDTMSQTSSLVESSRSTALEQDFTVEGRKGRLECPFSENVAAGDSQPQPGNERRGSNQPSQEKDPTRASIPQQDHSASVNGVQASKCPIRFMDERPAEEIAHYIETHKHELPRSHELCLRRYQSSEQQIRKLDHKYGNVVSMIEDLGQLHKPMLPEKDQTRCPSNASRPSRDHHHNHHNHHHHHHHLRSPSNDERVENWAHQVSTSDAPAPGPANDDNEPAPADDDRQGRFDQDLKEVRVGESPSRPWGISVPVYEQSGSGGSDRDRGVRDRSSRLPANPEAKKCPFHHTKPPLAEMHAPPPGHDAAPVSRETPAQPPPPRGAGAGPPVSQPVFVNPETLKTTAPGVPQMIFTGPVFIGYPMEQAIQFMNQYRRQ